MNRVLLHKRIPLDFSHQGHATVKALAGEGDFPLPPGMPDIEIELHRTKLRITEHEAIRLGEALLAAAEMLAVRRDAGAADYPMRIGEDSPRARIAAARAVRDLNITGEGAQ